MTSVRRFFVFICFIFTALSAQQKELRILSASPKGATTSIDQSFRIIVTFSEPMTALTVGSESQGPYPLEITPSVKGTYRWLGTTTLAFIPSDTLPRATRFTVTIPAGTRSLSGAELPTSFTWSFETLRPAIERVKTSAKSSRFGLRDSVLLVFNQPIDFAATAQSISIRVMLPGRSEATTLPCTVRRATDDELLSDQFGRRDSSRLRPLSVAEAGKLARERECALVLVPSAPLQKGSWGTFDCKHVEAQEGPLDVEHELLIPFDVYDDLRVLGVRAGNDIKSYNNVQLLFSNPVSSKDLLAHLSFKGTDTVTKNIRWDETTADQSIHVDLVPDTLYEGVITAGLKDVFGTALVSDVPFSFHTPAYHSTISMTTGDLIIEAGRKHTLQVETCNCDTILLAMGKLDRDRLIPFLAGKQFLSGDKRVDIISEQIAENDRFKRLWNLSDPRNKTVAHAIDLDEVLGTACKGVAAVEVRQSKSGKSENTLRSVVQVTNLGLTVKYSPDSILVFVTHMKDALPAGGAEIEVRTDDNDVVWSGRADARGVVVLPGWAALDLKLQTELISYFSNGSVHPPRLWVIVKHDDDWTYMSLQWNDRSPRPSLSTIWKDWNPQPEQYHALLFTDRGLYKAGQTVNIKAIVRMRKHDEWHTVPKAEVILVVRDARGEEILNREMRLDEMGALSLALPIKSAAPTGRYSVALSVRTSDALKPLSFWMWAGEGSFRVEAFREAEFEVHASFGRESYTIGDTVLGRVDARYLFGAPMKEMPAEWDWWLGFESFTPKGYESYAFGAQYPLGKKTGSSTPGRMNASGKAVFDSSGAIAVSIPIPVKAYAGTYSLRLRGGATSASHQNLWTSSSITVHGGEYYVGVKPERSFLPVDSTLTCHLVTVTKDGVPVAGRAVTLTVNRRTWQSRYYPERMWFFAWETTSTDSLVDSAVVRTGKNPSAYRFTPSQPGFYYIDAQSVDDRGNMIRTQTSFYASGPGTVSWSEAESRTIELIADRATYAPGDKAEILVKSPYDRATALVTIEREGIFSHFTTMLEGNTPRLTIPIEHSYLPNVFVFVTLLHGDSTASLDSSATPNDGPSYKVGCINLPVAPEERHLHVTIETSKKEYKPGETVTAVVTVRNAQGAGIKSNLTISAADEGVLNLIDYHFPDPFKAYYQERPLGVRTTDTRSYFGRRRDVSRDMSASSVLIAMEGGVRSDFTPSAYWNPSLSTDDSGRAEIRFRLPDNLTSFKIMTLAQTMKSEFGEGETSFRVSKPLLLQPSLPRLARVGDVFDAGTVVINNTKEPMPVEIMAAASGIALEGSDRTRITLAPGESREVTFHFAAQRTDTAVVTFMAHSAKERDGLRCSFPVVSPRAKESAALFNSATELVREEQVFIPDSIDPEEGEMEVTAASSALVSLSGAMTYLFTYPYGCIEQRASSVLPIILAGDLIDAFHFDVFKLKDYKDVAQSTIDELQLFQTGDGGFAYWKGVDRAEPYISAYAVYTLLEAKEHGYDVGNRILERGLNYLAQRLEQKSLEAEGTIEADGCTRAFMLYVLARAGRPDRQGWLDTLFAQRATLPLFARGYLLRASVLLKKDAAIADELSRDLLNYLKVDPTGASFEEQNENALVSIFHSNTRTTAVILQALIETNREPAVAERIVRRLLSLQRNGRWRTTQENLYVVAALAAYYKKFEAEEPDFRAEIAMNGKTLLTELFDGRSLETKKEHVPLSKLLKGKAQPVSIAKQGEGRLYYGIRLNYRPMTEPSPRSEGLTVSRTMQPFDSSNGAELYTGMLMKVTVKIVADQERYYVAADDPVPSGFEVVSTTFVTSNSRLKENDGSWSRFNHVERYDDRVSLFADYLPAGVHTYTYYVRAIHAGTYVVPPTHAECMYEPEVFGSTASGMVTIYK